MNKNITKLINTGFFHVFGSNVLNKIMQFASGIFIVRVLTQLEYGLFTYSQNIISFFLLLNGFGIMSGLLQYGSKTTDDNKKAEYIKYTVKVSIFSSAILIFLILIYFYFGEFITNDARNVFLLMVFTPITSLLVEFIQIKNRIDLNNKAMAIFSNVNTFMNLTGMIIGGYFFGITGVVIGKYLGNLIPVIMYRENIIYVFKKWNYIANLEKKEKKEINKFSLISMTNNSISQLLYLLDVFLIGIMIVDSLVIAEYKTATLIPIALNFIPLSLMVYIYPYFARNSEDKEWIYDKYKKMILFFGLFNLLISLFLVFLAKPIIYIIFGEQYLGIVPIFQVFAIGYFFAGTFRIPGGNILASIGAVKYNFYTTIISGLLNIILSVILINVYGAMGAALATVLIFIISGLMSNIVILRKIKPNKKYN